MVMLLRISASMFLYDWISHHKSVKQTALKMYDFNDRLVSHAGIKKKISGNIHQYFVGRCYMSSLHVICFRGIAISNCAECQDTLIEQSD